MCDSSHESYQVSGGGGLAAVGGVAGAKKTAATLSYRSSVPVAGQSPERGCSADLRRNVGRTAHVAFGVDLRHVGLAVAEQDLGGFEAVLATDARGVVVA